MNDEQPKPKKSFNLPPKDPGADPDRKKRQVARMRIREARDRELRRMGAGPESRGINRIGAAFALVAMVLLGAGLVTASRTTRERGPARTPESDLRDTVEAMDTIAMALAHFKADCGRYPQSSEGLLALVSQTGVPGWCGPYVNRTPSDSWNRGYLYALSGDVPELRSAGPDREFHTADDLVAAPEKFHCHPDFVPHEKSRLENAHSFSVGIGN